jgi:hypothetical protein
MPGKKATQAERTRALKALAEGLNQNEVARLLNRSPAWVSELIRSPEGKKIKQRRDIPDPLEYQQLSSQAREAYDSFNAFRRRYFAREEIAWAEQTAQQLVAALADPAKSYLALVGPSGVGKSSLVEDLTVWALVRRRSLRVMLASETLPRAKDLLRWVKARFEATVPFYDHREGRTAEGVLQFDYGRLVPQSAQGDMVMWREGDIIIPQLGDFDLSSKEPSIQIGSRDSTIQGARIDLLIMDDIVSAKTYNDPALSSWWSKEVERRIDPGGVLLLVGSRVGAQDLFHELSEKQYENDDGEIVKKYISIAFPAHNEATCDAAVGGTHRQWDGDTDGCLLDEKRVSWAEILAHRDDGNFSTLFQQSPEGDRGGLVPKLWITGGDEGGEVFPGCLDVDRALGEDPTKMEPGLIVYATVDPAAGGRWAVMVWCTIPKPDARRCLLHAVHREMRVDEFIRIDPASGSLVGVMMDVERQFRPKVIVVEANYAAGLSQSTAFGLYSRLYEKLLLMPRTGSDRNASIQGLLPPLFRAGLIRIPYRDEPSRTFARQFISELAVFPHGRTADLVIATWLAERERRAILQRGTGSVHPTPVVRVGGKYHRERGGGIDPDSEQHLKRSHVMVPCHVCDHTSWCIECDGHTFCPVECDCEGQETYQQVQPAAARPRRPSMPYDRLSVEEAIRARASALEAAPSSAIARMALGLPVRALDQPMERGGRPDGTRAEMGW